MQFDWWTFALQVINFLILAWLLQRFLYKPVRAIIAERRALVDAKLEEAEKSKKDAEDEKKRLQEANAQFASEREKHLADLHKELTEEKEKVLGDARLKAQEIVEQGRAQIENERAEALKELKAQILLRIWPPRSSPTDRASLSRSLSNSGSMFRDSPMKNCANCISVWRKKTPSYVSRRRRP
jgi:ATP synthase F0 subunit b